MSRIYRQQRIPIIRRNTGVYIRWWYNGWHYWLFYPGVINYKTEGEKYRTYGTRYRKLSTGQVSGSQIEAIRSLLNSTQIKIYTDSGWGEFRIESGEVVVLRNDIDAYSMEITGIIGSRAISSTGSSPIIEIPVAPAPSFCSIEIGNQSWGCANWASAYPSSKVYDDNEDYRSLYGGLYTYAMVMTPGFCPDGWKVPSVAEWETLIELIGGLSLAGKLKELGLTYWDSPNTDAASYMDFNVRGSGYARKVFYGYDYGEMNQSAYFLTSDVYDSWRFKAVKFSYDTGEVSIVPMPMAGLYPIRLKKVDINYDVIIGTQTWMKYNVSDSISGAMLPNNDVDNVPLYGRLYKQSQISEIETLHPGYHVPSMEEFLTLINYAGGPDTGGINLKEAGYSHWEYYDPSIYSIDLYGFFGLPAGKYYGGPINFGRFGHFLSTDTEELYPVQGLSLEYYTNFAVPDIFLSALPDEEYFSIRLIKDI